MNTTVNDLRKQINEVWRDITFGAVDNIEYVNTRPLSPTSGIAPETYTRIWEARRDAGLDYDENDPEQQKFINPNNRNNGTNNSSAS